MVRLTVRAKPRAKISRIVAVDGLSVVIALAAPPVDGAANEELVRFLAETLGIAKRQVRIAVGASSKQKLVDIDGLEAGDLAARLSTSMT